MNILVLIPRPRRLEYAFFGGDDRKALLESHLSGFPSEGEAMVGTLRKIRADCTAFNAEPLDVVIIRSAYGGSLFTRTSRVDGETLSQLAGLAVEAPMHVPPVFLLAQASLQAF